MSKCSRCIYGFIGGFGSWGCEYINVTGELRGCPAGDACTRYVSRKSALRKPSHVPMKHKKTIKEDNSMAAKAKLSEEQKRSIVTESQAGAKVGELAVKYDVSKSSIHRVITDYNEHGERAFSEPAADEETEAQTTDTEKEPETAATETGSEQENCIDIPADIIPESEENVKTVSEEKEEKDEPLIPEAVVEACWARINDLRTQIAAEQAVIDDWERQIAEIKEFLELARIANPVGVTS